MPLEVTNSCHTASQGTVLSQDTPSPHLPQFAQHGRLWQDTDVTGLQMARADAHPQDTASCALYISGSLWCRSRWCGLPQEHGAPCVSALPIPSGNRTASSSWSRDPMGTTHSFHIVLTGGKVGREARGRGAAPPMALGAPGNPRSPTRGRRPQRKSPQRWLWKTSFLLPPPLHSVARLPSTPWLWPSASRLTRTAALHGAVGCCGALGTGWIAAALVQVQAPLTLGAEVVAEAGLTVLDLAF